MPRPGKKRHTGCPIAFALDTFGDRWSLLVVRDILMRGCRTYGEFLDGGESVATNVLAERLKELEAADILSKSRDPENRRRYIYALTEKGLGLAPLMVEMVRWSGTHDPDTMVPPKIVDWIETDREGFLAGILARLTGK